MQATRRVLDRLVGFEFHLYLWKKVQRGLSAGRVQSVAVRLIVERENEIQNFISKSSFKIVAFFVNSDGKLVKAELPQRFDIDEANAFMQKCRDASFTVRIFGQVPCKKVTCTTFYNFYITTRSIKKVGFSVSQTMIVAQKVYEAGFITYMRTDSVNLSNDALLMPLYKKLQHGIELLQERFYSKKINGRSRST